MLLTIPWRHEEGPVDEVVGEELVRTSHEGVVLDYGWSSNLEAATFTAIGCTNMGSDMLHLRVLHKLDNLPNKQSRRVIVPRCKEAVTDGER